MRSRSMCSMDPRLPGLKTLRAFRYLDLEYLEKTEIFYIVQVMSYGVGGSIQGHLDTVATNSQFYRDEK